MSVNVPSPFCLYRYKATSTCGAGNVVNNPKRRLKALKVN